VVVGKVVHNHYQMDLQEYKILVVVEVVEEIMPEDLVLL
jgi:hypothetical protein